MTYCENCGCKVYKNGCVNCNEIEYIEDQYNELDLDCPDSVRLEAERSRKERFKKGEV